MTIKDYMNLAADVFRESPWLSAIQGCIEGLFFLWYASALPERQRKQWQSFALMAALLSVSIVLQAYNIELILYFPLSMLLWSVGLWLVTGCGAAKSIFSGSVFCLYAELGRLICRDGFLTLLLVRRPKYFTAVGCILIYLAVYFVFFLLGVRWLRRGAKKFEYLEVTAPQLAALLFPLLLYIAVRQSVFSYLDGLGYAAWLRLEFLQAAIAGCAEIVITTTGAMVSAQMERSDLLQKEMLNEKRRQQYLVQKETIEAVNRKYHDLKHYITAMETMENEELRGCVQAMRREIEPYESMQRTGSEVMDVLLAERMEECRKKGIRLVPYVDGRPLGFLSTIDLCVIFGNAMDNAIEATEKLTYVNMKEISVKIGVSDQLLILRFQNYYEGPLRYKGDRLLTGKADGANHGYGLENIRAAAARYGGTVACEAENQEFSLNILIPLPGQDGKPDASGD